MTTALLNAVNRLGSCAGVTKCASMRRRGSVKRFSSTLDTALFSKPRLPMRPPKLPNVAETSSSTFGGAAKLNVNRLCSGIGVSLKTPAMRMRVTYIHMSSLKQSALATHMWQIIALKGMLKQIAVLASHACARHNSQWPRIYSNRYAQQTCVLLANALMLQKRASSA